MNKPTPINEQQPRAFIQEALVLSVVSGLTYLAAYSFQKSFLSYFQVDHVFVEINTRTILFCAASIISVIFVLWQLSNIVPRKLTQPAMKFLFHHIFEVFSVGIFLTLFISSGFSWTAVAFFFISSLFLIISLITIIRRVRRGESYSDILDRSMEVEVEIRGQMLGTHLLDVMPRQYGSLIILIIAIPPLMGLLGTFSASTQVGYSLFEHKEQEYVIVEQFADGIVASAVRIDEEDKEIAIIIGITKFLKNSSLEDIELQNNKMMVVGHLDSPSKPKVSFSEFRSRVSNLFTAVNGN